MILRRPRFPSGPSRGRGVAGAAALGILFFSLTAGKTGAAPGENASRVAKGDFKSALVLTGSLKALQSEEFKVPVTDNWRLQIKWMVKEGDSVKPGDPVVRFDTANLDSDVETAQDSLRTKLEEKAQKEADYRHQKFELDVEVKTADNDAKLKGIDASVPPGIESRYEYDRKQLEKKKSDYTLENAKTKRIVKLMEAESQIKTLEIEVKELRARLEKLQATLRSMTLSAHTSGAVVYDVEEWSGRKVQVGDTVYSTRTVALIPDLSSLQVQAWVSETHIQQLRIGQEADVYLDAYPDKRCKGLVKEVSKSAEAVRRWGQGHYFKVDIGVDKLDPEIMKPGMSVKCDIFGSPVKDALLVPLEMTAFDGQSFWIRPGAGEPVKIIPLGFNEFVLAASADQNPGLKAGLALRPVGSLKSGKETESREKK
ncbi:MAG: efflux RND transporter periplasmic adaptor subunit [Acidobacteriota bacterium]